MLLALALMGQGLAQDMKLNADATQAIGCGRAVMAGVPAGRGPSPRTILQTVYFVMSAADTDPGAGTRYYDRVTELAPEIFSGPTLKAADVTATLAGCDKRFPLWRGTTPAKLPADPYTRDLMCGSTLAYSSRFLESLGLLEGGPDFKGLIDRYMKRIPITMLLAHGVTDEKSMSAALETALRDSLRVGNLVALTEACTLALDAK